LTDGPGATEPPDTIDHVGVHRQRDGRYFVGVAPVAGRISGTMLERLAGVVAEHGSIRIRTTPYQKLLVLDIAEDRVDSLVSGLRDIGLEANPSQYRRGAMACTGIEYCKLAIVETKARTAELVTEMERRVPELDVPISINVNGCPNACARTQVADIGLKGQLMLDDQGRQAEGFQVHLGGGLGLGAGFGRKLRGLKTTAADLPDYVERVVRNYLKQREPGERFAEWAARAPEADLR
jgi:sulfite reductase (ferredoxin)